MTITPYDHVCLDLAVRLQALGEMDKYEVGREIFIEHYRDIKSHLAWEGEYTLRKARNLLVHYQRFMVDTYRCQDRRFEYFHAYVMDLVNEVCEEFPLERCAVMIP